MDIPFRGSMEYFTIAVVAMCSVVLVAIICTILCWVLLFHRHSKVRQKRAERLKSRDWSSTHSLSKPPVDMQVATVNTNMSKAATYNSGAFSGSLSRSSQLNLGFRYGDFTDTIT